jgi:bile acid-coenzyme A ligase
LIQRKSWNEMSLIPLGQFPAINAARLGADEWAIRYDDEVLTWGELENRSTKRAWAYRDRGVAQGDWVTLGVPNGIAFYEIMFALWKIGATPHVVSNRLPFAELQGIVELARPKLVITDDAVSAAQLGALPVAFGRDFYRTDPLPVVLSNPWKAMSSGGSTGRPKIIASVTPGTYDPDSPRWLNLPETGTILSTGPVYHNMPVTTNLRALFHGLKVVGMVRFDPEQALRLIQEFRVAWTSFVPTMMSRISRLPRAVRERYDLSSLQSVWHWAAPMPPVLKREWIDWLGASKIWELYGGTEGIGTTIISGTDWLSHPGSVGQPVSDKIMILDDDGKEAPVGATGEIYALPANGQGSTYRYVGAEPRSSPTGYETLGDYGWIDDDGFLYIADRRTDLILSGGANIFPAEVEAALLEHPMVEGAVVIGLPDEDLGAVVHAIVKPVDRQATHLDQETLLTFLADRLARYKIPRSIEFTSEQVRDDAGKVRRQKLREDRLSRQR